MTNIIDLEGYKKKVAESVASMAFNITQEDQEEVDKLALEITEKYIKKLNEGDHSFAIQATPSQTKLVQQMIDELTKDLNGIIVELIHDLTRKTVELYLLKKYRRQ